MKFLINEAPKNVGHVNREDCVNVVGKIRS